MSYKPVPEVISCHTSVDALNPIAVSVAGQLRDAVSIPLVIHGASGMGYKNISKLVEMGVCKFNLQTYLSEAAIYSAKKYLDENRENLDISKKLLKSVSESADKGWKEELKRYIKALKSEGKATK